ncbi:MAG TPA: serine/threonine-protein kinase, partial [Isosphaeraceae bacterium]|nr:serine/threonine-protein kinase [Isosphaeraceae bacterium]
MSNPSLDAHINRCSDCQAALDDLAREQSATTGQGAARVPAAEELPRIAGFEIERELGRGGMGVVYLAREIKPDRTVAVKFLPSGPFASLRDRERWLKEARAAARVRHPHIVHLHRVDEAGGWLYLVLEYLSGGSLKDRLTGPLTPRLAAKLLVPIAEALEELHRAGVWHLDLKPANILIDAAPGTPLDRAPLKLTDFGIARSCEDLDPTGSSRGAAQGTLLYMAPEQVAGRLSAFGPATDIHAMGSILYELLTGRPPFLADSDAETMQQVQTREPVPPRRLNPKVSRDLETICQKCLEKDPGRRYASAAELAGDLERFLNGKPISARPVSLLEKSWRLCLRRPAIASLVSALILTLGCGFVGLFTLWRRAEAERARVVVERGLAESARLLAEKNEKLATRTLNEFSDVLYRILEKPDSLPEARITELVYFLKQRTADSVSCRAEGPWNAPGVGVLEWVLARKLFSRGKRQEARSLVADSVAYLRECHRLEPDDQNTLWQLGQSLLASGQLAAEDSAFEEALAFYDEASSLSGTLKMLSNRLELVNEVHEVRRLLAVQLATRGDWQQVQRVEQSDHWLLLSIGYANTNEPESKLHVAWTLEELETA